MESKRWHFLSTRGNEQGTPETHSGKLVRKPLQGERRAGAAHPSAGQIPSWSSVPGLRTKLKGGGEDKGERGIRR